MIRAVVTKFVPVNASLGVIAIGSNLNGCLWSVFVVPAEYSDEFLFQSIAPKAELILFHRMDPELCPFARADPLGPHVAQEPTREQAELIWFHSKACVNHFRAEALFTQSDAVRASG